MEGVISRACVRKRIQEIAKTALNFTKNKIYGTMQQLNYKLGAIYSKFYVNFIKSNHNII